MEKDNSIRVRIDNRMKEYLVKKSKIAGISESEVIRGIIQREMNRNKKSVDNETI